MTSQADLIAQAVLDQFHKLPAKRKPAVRDNGLHEWVPLSGIVAEKNGVLTCLALATGMKCLPVSKIAQSNGVGIHDWHAEVLAIRTFNRFLLDECHGLLDRDNGESILRRKRGISDSDGVSLQLFEIQEDVRLHMYCSEAPCGDASMELTMAAQKDASAWKTPTPITGTPNPNADASLLGRACFSRTGIVRRKPARGDAPPTLSKSCSDKLALKQCTSLLSSLASIFIDPTNAYIHSIVLPESQYSDVACHRAFSAEGRMKPLVGKVWPAGYSFKEFSALTTDLEFEFSKIAVKARSDRISASNLAATWSLSGFEENIIGGVIQGRKAFKTNAASRTSRRSIWEAASDLAERLDEYSAAARYVTSSTYRDVKQGQLTIHRRRVKDETRETALVGWIRNDGGSDFQLEKRSNH
ncbi:adenosine deaminase/editase [Fusarium flagelliforme]|uniref:Putative trna-specific adenosine deaminase 1 n=1 Tax=Fusarium flagelliforme TaxID=2675880 RepID=A0A395MTH8_9HYPO|nr:adenosine deaminase/editase [Fusarium flagelliforme]KAH7185557.1 adenosine deaminase/editase [Fusarium flagelliforme]RFN51080.1 putative trna-specific adenosine deaminase 1 [Fusarium flagelliforme]